MKKIYQFLPVLLALPFSVYAQDKPCGVELTFKNEGAVISDQEFENASTILDEKGIASLGVQSTSVYLDYMGRPNIGNASMLIGSIVKPEPRCKYRFKRKVTKANWFILSQSPTEGKSIIDLEKEVRELMPELTPPYMDKIDASAVDVTPSNTGKIYSFFSTATSTGGTLALADMGDVFIHDMELEEWVEAKKGDGSYEKVSNVIKYSSASTYVADEGKQWVKMEEGMSIETMDLNGPPYKGEGTPIEDRTYGVVLLKFPVMVKVEGIDEPLMTKKEDWTPYSIKNEIIEIK